MVSILRSLRLLDLFVTDETIGGIGTLHFIKSGMRDEMKKVISEKDQ